MKFNWYGAGSEQMVGVECFSKERVRTYRDKTTKELKTRPGKDISHYLKHRGYFRDGRNFLDEAISKGWDVGVVGASVGIGDGANVGSL